MAWQILQQIKGIVDDDDDDDDDAEPDYDVLSDVTQHHHHHQQQQQQQQSRGPPDDVICPVASTSSVVNPDVISCGESQRSRAYTCTSNKTLRSAFVKRYNALSKRSAKNKSQRRPGLQQVFDNAAFHRDHV